MKKQTSFIKETFFALSFLTGIATYGQNKFLAGSYWKRHPDLKTVMADAEEGNSPCELNIYRYDSVVQAINNKAPLEVVRFLIEKCGNNVNHLTGHERSYLHYAALQNRPDLIEYLIKNGADMYQEDTLSTTPAEYGIWIGQLNKVGLQKFFDAGYPAQRKNSDGANLLMLSGYKETADLETTNYLISKGISPSDKDSQGRYFVDYAARGGKAEVMKALQEKKYPYSNQALILAASGFRSVNPLPVLKYLVEEMKISPKAKSPEGKNVLHLLAPWANSEEQIDYFLAKNVSPTDQDDDGNTPIFSASRNRTEKNLVQMLAKISNLKVINIANSKGQTPLMMAAKYSTAEAMAILIERGADQDAKDSDGNGILFYLADSYKIRGKNELAIIEKKIKLLQAHNFDFRQRSAEGNTFLHLAAAQDSPELLELAHTVFKDIDALNDYDLSPLMTNATVAKSADSMQKLISWGAKKDLRSSFGETAFSLSADNQFLKDKKADLNFLRPD